MDRFSKSYAQNFPRELDGHKTEFMTSKNIPTKKSPASAVFTGGFYQISKGESIQQCYIMSFEK